MGGKIESSYKARNFLQPKIGWGVGRYSGPDINICIYLIGGNKFTLK